jgi:hypothetical protein
MKKTIIILLIIFVSIQSKAQEHYNPLEDKTFMSEMGRTTYVVIVFALIMGFIIAMTRMLLDYRIKRKMIDKGISEVLATKLLQTAKNTRNESLKWFLILLSAATGFFLVSLYQPLGIHSLGIMSLAMAVGVFTYYFVIRKTDN